MKTTKTAKSDGRGAQDELIKMMEEYCIVLPRNAADWRVAHNEDGAPRNGNMPGLFANVRMLCTDGMVAYFLLDSGAVVYGHHANFQEHKKEKQPREAGQGRRGKASPSKSVQQALDLLNDLCK